MNFGCSGNCSICPTRGFSGCRKLTLEGMINWKEIEYAVKAINPDTVVLMGGEDPFINCRGHLAVYSSLKDIVVRKLKKRFMAIANYNTNPTTTVASYFNDIIIYVPKIWRYSNNMKVANTSYLKMFAKITTLIEADELVNEAFIQRVRREFFSNPTILVLPEDYKNISYLQGRYSDISFVGNFIGSRYPVLSISDCSYTRYNKCKNGIKNWRGDVVEIKENEKLKINEEK